MITRENLKCAILDSYSNRFLQKNTFFSFRMFQVFFFIEPKISQILTYLPNILFQQIRAPQKQKKQSNHFDECPLALGRFSFTARPNFRCYCKGTLPHFALFRSALAARPVAEIVAPFMIVFRRLAANACTGIFEPASHFLLIDNDPVFNQGDQARWMTVALRHEFVLEIVERFDQPSIAFVIQQSLQ